jgi:hypothetical protein
LNPLGATKISTVVIVASCYASSAHCVNGPLTKGVIPFCGQREREKGGLTWLRLREKAEEDWNKKEGGGRAWPSAAAAAVQLSFPLCLWRPQFGTSSQNDGWMEKKKKDRAGFYNMSRKNNLERQMV